MAGIRMIWFDIGRVLYDHFIDELIEDLSTRSYSRMKPYELYDKIKRSELVTKYDLGQLCTEDFGYEMQKLLDLPDRLWFIARWQKTLAPNRRLWRLAADLRRNLYPLGIISNINQLHAEYIENVLSCGSIMQFRPRIYSFREGFAKPDSEIFRIALEKANREYPWSEELRADECAFIDDRSENIAAARALGWHAIQHIPTFVSGTMIELSKLGVKI